MSAYGSPEALEAAIVARLRSRFGAAELARRRPEVAYRRLVARLAATSPGRWVVKGGYGLILRLDPNRMSNDIDVVYIDVAGEHAAALEALERACATDLGDRFSFAIVAIGDADEDRARSATVRAALGLREWCRFSVDLAVPRPDVPSSELDAAPALTGITEIDDLPPGLHVLAWPQQIAEKTCGIFERREGGPSGRVRDMLDLAMIASQVDGIDGTALIDALRRETTRRPLLPDGLPTTAELPDDQRELWRRATRRSTRSAPIDLEDAERIVRGFLDPVLDGTARGARWDASAGAWRATDEIATAAGSDTA